MRVIRFFDGKEYLVTIKESRKKLNMMPTSSLKANVPNRVKATHSPGVDYVPIHRTVPIPPEVSCLKLEGFVLSPRKLKQRKARAVKKLHKERAAHDRLRDQNRRREDMLRHFVPRPETIPEQRPAQDLGAHRPQLVDSAVEDDILQLWYQFQMKHSDATGDCSVPYLPRRRQCKYLPPWTHQQSATGGDTVVLDLFSPEQKWWVHFASTLLADLKKVFTLLTTINRSQVPSARVLSNVCNCEYCSTSSSLPWQDNGREFSEYVFIPEEY